MVDTSGRVNIHGREYKTVALRVTEFRAAHPEWAILTELVSVDEQTVVVKASITDAESRILATGHAEEQRAASQINRTSALENCETSAIGRALAALGFGGSEFASANEVENAKHQQDQKKPPANPPKGNVTAKSPVSSEAAVEAMGAIINFPRLQEAKERAIKAYQGDARTKLLDAISAQFLALGAVRKAEAGSIQELKDLAEDLVPHNGLCRDDAGYTRLFNEIDAKRADLTEPAQA